MSTVFELHAQYKRIKEWVGVPYLYLKNGVAYNISDKATRDLKFKEHYLQFWASSKSKVGLVKIFYKDVDYIGIEDSNQD